MKYEYEKKISIKINMAEFLWILDYIKKARRQIIILLKFGEVPIKIITKYIKASFIKLTKMM